MEKRKILIDTDIGDDIDDAFALALALSSEEIETVGITTVFRNTRARAQQVQNCCKRWGKTCPCGRGNGCPYMNPFTPSIKTRPRRSKRNRLVNGKNRTILSPCGKMR